VSSNKAIRKKDKQRKEEAYGKYKYGLQRN